jgi:nucleotide-binding universal stress UspA family protein
MQPTILVLANLAEGAEPAAQYAAALAAPLPAHLALLHLDLYPVLLEPELVAAASEQTTRQEAATMAALWSLAQRLPVPTEVVETAGVLADAVAAAVQQYHPLLLVMGLSAEQSLFDALLLNQLLPVLRAIHRPLLLVPKGGPTLGMPRRVLVAVDAEPFTASAASLALAPLLSSWQAAYTVAHVGSILGDALGTSGRMALADVRASELLPPEAPLALLEECYQAPVAGIRQAIIDTQADLVVLLVRPRSFMGRLFHHSVTAEVLRHATVPVLLLPVESPEQPIWFHRQESLS